jgi:S-adenosylmethionine hydrolase
MTAISNRESVITLLTDFGLQDVYVGIIKGVIATINPHLKIIDLTHQIPPQNILAGRFALKNAFPYFPENTVHVAIVDPGVGSERKGVAIAVNNSFLVGPNNGLFSGILEEYKPQIVRELTNPKYWLNPNPSHTFHGRDIFATVAAHLASGISIENLGPKIDVNNLKKVHIPEYQKINQEIIGSIQYIDVFGNLITNIPAKILLNKSWQVLIDNVLIGRGKTYSSVPPGQLVALIGSHGWLEIAVNSGNAKIELQKNWGDQIRIKLS